MSKKVQIPLQLDEDTDSHGLNGQSNGPQQVSGGFLNDSSSTLRKIRSLEQIQQIQQLKKHAKTGLGIQSKHPTLHVTLVSPVNRLTDSGKSPVYANSTMYTSDRSAGLKPGTTDKGEKRNTARGNLVPSVEELMRQLESKDEEISKLQRDNQSLQTTVRQLQREIHQLAVKENELVKVFGGSGIMTNAANLQGNTTSRQRKPKMKLSKMSPSSHMMSTMTSTINSTQKNLSPRKEKLLSIQNLNNKETVEMLSIDRHKTLEDIYRKTHSSIKSIASFRANGTGREGNGDQYSISSKHQMTTPLLNALISPKNGPTDSGTDVPVLMDLQSKASFYPSDDIEVTGQEPDDALTRLKARFVKVLTGYKNKVETLRAENQGK